jgi:hypothetical protein
VHSICRFLVFFALAGGSLFVVSAQGQDAPSLGDVARQARQQKQKDAPPKDAQPTDGQTQSPQSQSSQNKEGQRKEPQSKSSQSKDAPSKDAPLHKASHVITDDELPQRAIAGVKTPSAATSRGPAAPGPAFDGKPSPDEVKSQIQEQKSAISSLESQINELNDSIHYVGGNCVANCVAWNENQQAKQRQVEDMRSQLENAKQALEQMQDYARKAGFGSSVYDPE